MGCVPSHHLRPPGGCCLLRPPPSHHASNHLLSGTSTNESTPLRPEKEKGDLGQDEKIVNKNPFKLIPLKLNLSSVKTLLVFPKEDAVSEKWSQVCRRRGPHVSLVSTSDDAVKSHFESPVDLIVVDSRYTKVLRADTLCSSIRSGDSSARCVVVAIVKKRIFRRDCQKIRCLLNAGFNRVLRESNSAEVIENDLRQVEKCDLLLLQQEQMYRALEYAVDCCKDVIHITDNHHKIQYMNHACESTLGYTIEELFDKTLWEIHGSEHHRQDMKTPTIELKQIEPRRPSLKLKSPNDKGHELQEIKETSVCLDVSEAVNMQMRRGKEWEGLLSCRRKSGGVVQLVSKVIPVQVSAKKNDYFVYWSDGHAAVERGESLAARGSGSVRSGRKGSYDIRSINSDGERRSSIIRRQSVAKIHNHMTEAPITKVVSLINAVQDSSPAYVSQALEKVLEILRSTELYNPPPIHDHHKAVPADPVATDLLGALLAHGPKPLSTSARRGSTVDLSLGRSSSNKPSLPTFQQASQAIRELLVDHLSWNFDVIKLEGLSDKRPLVWLGMSLMCEFEIPAVFEVDEKTIQNWLTLIEANYHSANSYHNSTHASDVLQATAYFLRLERIREIMDPLDTAASLIAAVVHDVNHPGKNSQFLCNTNNELAILYNDVCVLESHHAALAFKLTTSDNRVNILKGLDRDSYKFVRKTVIDMVLATDMSKHFEHVNKFINMLDKCSVEKEPDSDAAQEIETGNSIIDYSLLNTTQNLEIIRRMMIKCADINNPLRPLQLCRDWAHRIANEYFSQTEEEKRRNIPVVMPQFDRVTCSIPKSQIGFMEFFIFDMFEAWNDLAQTPELLHHLRENFKYWKGIDVENERNDSTCEEIRTSNLETSNNKTIEEEEEEAEEEEEEAKAKTEAS